MLLSTKLRDVALGLRELIKLVRRATSDEVSQKLQTIHSAVRHEFPSGDIEMMLAEIERGKGSIRE